jgi:hypothetical protein
VPQYTARVCKFSDNDSQDMQNTRAKLTRPLKSLSLTLEYSSNNGRLVVSQ